MDSMESKRVALLQQLRAELKDRDNSLSTEPEDQQSPTLAFAGIKVESIAQKGDVVIPERSGASVFRVELRKENINFIISTAEATKSAVFEPVSSVLEKIVRIKGVEPTLYGEEGEKGLMDAEAEILDLAVKHGVSPLFFKDNGEPEDGVFVIPGKGIVFVEEYSKDLSDSENLVEDDLSKYRKYEEVKALNPDLSLPKEENPFGNNWAIEVRAEEDTDSEDATKTVSLEVRREQIQKLLFKNDPRKIYRITAFLQDEPLQIEQLTQPSDNQATFLPAIEPNGVSVGASNQITENVQIPTMGGATGTFIPTVANFTWAPDANQQSVAGTNNASISLNSDLVISETVPYDVVVEATQVADAYQGASPTATVLDEAEMVAGNYEANNPLPATPAPAAFSGFLTKAQPGDVQMMPGSLAVSNKKND